MAEPETLTPEPAGCCRACEAPTADATRYDIEESMFGLGEHFRYRECAVCRSLSIETVPEDLARHYPPHYYSLHDVSTDSRFTRWVKRHRDRAAVGRFDPVGKMVLRRYPSEALEALRLLALCSDARILDVGCGSGTMLRQLRAIGFTKLYGTDPFLPRDIVEQYLTIRCAPLAAIDGTYDVITFNHVLEHLADPVTSLNAAADRLARGGSIVVRVPLAGCRAWDMYGVHWIQLDPPRHLVLPSRTGMERLARRAGLAVTRVVFDSTAYQFWGSEQMRAGITLFAPKSWRVSRDTAAVVTPSRMRAWRRQATAWNRIGIGDQAAFVLEKPATAAG
jgi:SAM-dependent methyltransferase